MEALKKPELAAGLYEFAVAKAPDPATFHELGRLYCSGPNSLDRQKGIDYLQRALALDPKDPRAASLLAECYSRLGDQENARLWQERAINIPNNR